ncbi:MAG: hypothetical protein K2W95_04175 [Candidatus Obscuribacterales bacterium]|nr:hypothetical protein [Candidatus Obscuribacterales bacterium]
MTIWLLFVACASVILFAGSQLSRYGDVIAERTGLGGNWIGLVLLATVTSLPELITGVSSVTLNDLPDMAVSGTLGSCMFNMLVIALLDLLTKRPVSNMVHQGHILSAGFGIVLIGLAAIDIGFNKYLPQVSVLNSIGVISLLYIAIYLLAMRLIYAYDRQQILDFVEEVASQESTAKMSLVRALIMFSLNALLIVIAACYLPALGEQIAKLTGWGESFVGSSFIAITTSLPEITVSVAAARMGSFDMAVANLLGSNLFNIAILAIIDLCYRKGPLLHAVSQINAIPALTAIICMGIVVIGLTYRSEKKILFLAGDAAAIVVVCVLANILLFIAH